MSVALKVIVPQYEAVEIVFAPLEAIMGGKHPGLDAWISCIPCGGQYEWLPADGYFKCAGCFCDVSKTEMAVLIEQYKQELNKLLSSFMAEKPRRSWWSRIFGKQKTIR